MPINNRITLSTEIGGVTINSTFTRTTNGNRGDAPSLPAAKAGTLSTRTDADEGELTLAAGHGVVAGNLLDVYWDGGRRYNVLAGVVAGNDVPISGGAGDDLPAQDTALTCQVQQDVDIDFAGSDVELLGVKCADRARVQFYKTPPGVLTTRTDNATGTLTMAAGHALVQGDIVDVHWAGGVRYGVAVGVVAGNSVPISGGSGDNLPVEDSAVTCHKPVLGLDLEANQAWFWLNGMSTNPLAGEEVTVVKATHASSSAAAELRIGVALNS